MKGGCTVYHAQGHKEFLTAVMHVLEIYVMWTSLPKTTGLTCGFSLG